MSKSISHVDLEIGTKTSNNGKQIMLTPPQITENIATGSSIRTGDGVILKLMRSMCTNRLSDRTFAAFIFFMNKILFLPFHFVERNFSENFNCCGWIQMTFPRPSIKVDCL